MLTLCKSTPLGELHPHVFVVDTTTTPDALIHNTTLPVADINMSHSNLSSQQKQQLLDVFKMFKDVFANGGEPFCCTSVVQHDI